MSTSSSGKDQSRPNFETHRTAGKPKQGVYKEDIDPNLAVEVTVCGSCGISFAYERHHELSDPSDSFGDDDDTQYLCPKCRAKAEHNQLDDYARSK